MNNQIFEKLNGSWISSDFEFNCVNFPKAGNVAAYMKKEHPSYKVGFKATDIGFAVARACNAAGFGETLWMI